MGTCDRGQFHWFLQDCSFVAVACCIPGLDSEVVRLVLLQETTTEFSFFSIDASNGWVVFVLFLFEIDEVLVDVTLAWSVPFQGYFSFWNVTHSEVRRHFWNVWRGKNICESCNKWTTDFTQGTILAYFWRTLVQRVLPPFCSVPAHWRHWLWQSSLSRSWDLRVDSGFLSRPPMPLCSTSLCRTRSSQQGSAEWGSVHHV